MSAPRFVDLSFPIEDGMEALPGVLPPAKVGAVLDHDASRPRYEGKAEFHLGTIEMSLNTGTYIDVPFHRHRDGEDLAAIPLERVAGLPGVVVEASAEPGPIEFPLRPNDLRGAAVLVRTGWDRRWGEERYWQGDPWLSATAVDLLIESGAALVGVDFTNVDDTSDPERPAHTRLLEAGVLIVEHLRGLDALPPAGFRFSAVPIRVPGAGCFPVRAYAELTG
jgi:kynurenine formamidase